MADKRISQLIERTDIANNDVLPIVASGATTTNKVTISTIQDWMQSNLDVGVTSIGLTMPSAFQVSGSPITTSGNITVTAAGTASQYIRGDGTLADFPQGGGGGGASVSYYLNGSVSQGTIGGIAYREMNKTPILGAGTDFNISADGYIASFITDAGDPALLEIPAGNWNFETYFQASSAGGTPSFYVELYKVSGATATLIASNSANPELIAFGTNTTPYFSALAVPQTTLALTDRLAIRIYVVVSGRTITLHTENSNLCQIITTFTTGLTALNGLTAQVQNFATGTSGTDFNISSTGSIHTFNLPDASDSARGAVTTGSQVFGGVKTFANGLSLSAVGGSNQVTRIVNIGTLHEGSATLNQIGFNSGNNIYFGKGLSNGGVISWNNAAVRYYTLPNADGTIALTSDLGNYIQGVGTADSIPKFTGARTIANSAIRDTTSTVVISKNVSVDNGASQAINLTPASGGTTNRIETTGTLPLSLVTSGSSITLAAGGVTPQITLASTGAVTLTGALNGTSASFTSSSSNQLTLNGGTTIANRLLVARGTDDASQNLLLGWNGITVQRTSVPLSSPQTEFSIIQQGSDASRTVFNIASTGAATFSSSVTAAQLTLRNNSDSEFINIGQGTSTGKQLLIGSTYASNVFYLQGIQQNVGYNQNISLNPLGGNVGIGTASPDSQLTLNGSSNSRLNMRAGDTRYGTLYADNGVFAVSSITAIPLVFGTNDTEKMRITSSGNVGIGTASPQSTGNFTHLDVVGKNTTSGGAVWVSNSDKSTRGIFYNINNLVYSGTVTNHDYLLITNDTERMRITSGGNVGIGTASPTTYSLAGRHLEVNDAGGGYAFIHSNTTSVKSFFAANESGALAALFTFSNHPLTFGTNNTERMRITSGGDLLINKQTLSGGSVGVEFERNSSTRMTTDGNTVLLLNRLSSDGTIVDIRRSGTQVGTISVTTTATSYNTSSDYRLKENVKPIENALSVLTQLKPCTFNFIVNPEEEVIGFLAHEVQEVMPQAIKGEKDAVRIEQVEISPAELDEQGNVITEAVIEDKEVPVYQGIDHSKLVPLLVASIQELKAEIEALKSQING